MARQLSWLEHRTHKPGVGGSNPPPATKKMKLNKKSFQKFFKFISYSLFKILYGSVEGIIDPNNNDEIEIKFVKKNGKINYNVY